MKSVIPDSTQAPCLFYKSGSALLYLAFITSRNKNEDKEIFVRTWPFKKLPGSQRGITESHDKVYRDAVTIPAAVRQISSNVASSESIY